MRRLIRKSAGGARPTKGGAKRAAGSGRRTANRAAIRRKPMPRWQRNTLRFGSALAALGLVAGSLGWLWQSGWFGRQWEATVASAIDSSADLGLVVREVLVEGRGETSSEAIMAALQVRLGQPILSISPEEMRARVEALPWVRSATVERRLPDTLYLRIAEFQPMALWQRSQELVLVSRSGEVIDEPSIARFANLPVIVGDEAPEHAPALLDMLALRPELARRVTAAVWVSGRRWNLRLDNRIDVKLPEENGTAAWLELARLEREHGLLGRDLISVDLRVPDRVIVRVSPGAMERYRAPARST